jgi:hypothetical protein
MCIEGMGQLCRVGVSRPFWGYHLAWAEVDSHPSWVGLVLILSWWLIFILGWLVFVLGW